MPKMKTKKVVSKRIKKTGSGKLMKKRAGHGHYNARETGKTGRQKRMSNEISGVEHTTINHMTPY